MGMSQAANAPTDTAPTLTSFPPAPMVASSASSSTSVNAILAPATSSTKPTPPTATSTSPSAAQTGPPAFTAWPTTSMAPSSSSPASTVPIGSHASPMPSTENPFAGVSPWPTTQPLWDVPCTLMDNPFAAARPQPMPQRSFLDGKVRLILHHSRGRPVTIHQSRTLPLAKRMDQICSISGLPSMAEQEREHDPRIVVQDSDDTFIDPHDSPESIGLADGDSIHFHVYRISDSSASTG